MIELKTHQNFRYLIFAIIYVHQGFIEVFMAIYMSLYLTSHGVSILYVGLTLTIGNSPWIVKIFYGILSDRKKIGRMGRRIPYMIIGSIAAAILFFLLIPVNPLSNWAIFVLLIALANFFNAVADTSTDGLVVDTTPPEKSGSAQSVCWGSKFVGYLIASILVGFIVELFSWSIYFIFMGLFLLIPMPLLFIAQEPPYEIPERFPWNDLKETFKKRLVWIVVAMFILSETGLYCVLSMLPLFLSLDLGLNISMVGIVMSLGSAGFLTGCLISGPLLDKLSRRMSIGFSMTFLALMLFIVSLVQGLLMAFIIVVIAGIAWGFLQIAEMILSMDLCKPSISATMFSVYMSIINIGIMLGPLLGAVLVETVSFRPTFIIAALIVLSNIIFIIFIKGTETLFKKEIAI
ncbi:MAG: MFS transporter [Promethearchaeota archaeon]